MFVAFVPVKYVLTPSVASTPEESSLKPMVYPVPALIESVPSEFSDALRFGTPLRSAASEVMEVSSVVPGTPVEVMPSRSTLMRTVWLAPVCVFLTVTKNPPFTGPKGSWAKVVLFGSLNARVVSAARDDLRRTPRS